MNEEPCEYLAHLDEELLTGGVVLSEWCSEIVRQCDIAFIGGAFLGTILTAVAGAETYLRAEYSEGKKESIFDLIENSLIDSELKRDLHALRKYRNKWVHVEKPWEDEPLLENPEGVSDKLQDMAKFSCRVLRKTIYENPWI